MKILKNDVDSFNNLVFEKRNKDYGAYAIRASYNGNAIKSTLITTGSFLLLVLLINAFASGKISSEQKLVVPDENGGVLIAEMNLEEKKIDKPMSSRQNPAPKVSDSYVVQNQVTDTTTKPNTQDNFVAVTGNGNTNAIGTGKSDSVQAGGGGTGPGIPLEPVVKNDKPLLWAEKMPKFKGDLTRFIQSNIVFPEIALLNGVHGTVYVQFVVNENGSISDVKIARGIGYGCDEEAARVVSKMPQWTPGKMGDETVKVLYNIPIKFTSK